MIRSFENLYIFFVFSNVIEVEVKRVKKDDKNNIQHKGHSEDEVMNRVNQAFDRIAEDAQNLVNENNQKSNMK